MMPHANVVLILLGYQNTPEQMVFEEYCDINDYPCFDYLSPKVIL